MFLLRSIAVVREMRDQDGLENFKCPVFLGSFVTSWLVLISVLLLSLICSEKDEVMRLGIGTFV
jgi:hypothetical protein